MSSLEPGQDFNDLKPGMVVFICTSDPFGEKLYRYTFEERCLECNIPLGDETRKIFLNTEGTNDADVPVELIHFLKYVEHSTDEYVESVDDEAIHRLHERIAELKKDRILEEKYMSVEELLRDERQEGRQEGLQEGRQEGANEMLNLIQAMLADGKTDDISRLKTDSAFYKAMVEKYLK